MGLTEATTKDLALQNQVNMCSKITKMVPFRKTWSLFCGSSWKLILPAVAVLPHLRELSFENSHPPDKLGDLTETRGRSLPNTVPTP